MIHQGPIFSLALQCTSGHRLTYREQLRASVGAGRRAGARQLCVLLRAADVEDAPDAQEELAQHGAQLGDQLELQHLTQVRVVGGGVCPELIVTDF